MEVVNNKNVGSTKGHGMGIVIDDGSVRQPIINTHGDEIGVFYFRPTDLGILERYNKVIADFDKITEPLERTNINPDGTAGDDASAAALAEATKRLYEAVNYLFGGNMSEAFFGKMNPFSPVKGRFYCEHALDAVGKFIEAEFEVEGKMLERRMAKYTQDYEPRTGKHRNGGKRRRRKHH